jgi:hypothetical protein
MNKSIRDLLAAAALAALATVVSAQVLTFDDIGTGGAVPANYGGLDWSAGGWSYFGEPQAPYTPHSGSYRAFIGFAAPDAVTTIRFPTPHPFQGAWFSGYDVSDVSFRLFLGGSLIATSASLAPSETPTFLASGYSGLVDAVVLVAGGQNFFVMDDFTLGAARPVPEPRTYALMLAGLAVIGLFVAARRRKD